MEHFKFSGRSAWGGIFLSIIGNLNWQDIFKTTILAVIGTVVSLTVSALLAKLLRKNKR
jgi:fructose-specific phosphotransferase system IIC component